MIGVERARLAGVVLTTDTVEREISNRLALTIGDAGILADGDEPSPEQRELANPALLGAQSAAATVKRLGEITRVVGIGWGAIGLTFDIPHSARS